MVAERDVVDVGEQHRLAVALDGDDREHARQLDVEHALAVRRPAVTSMSTA